MTRCACLFQLAVPFLLFRFLVRPLHIMGCKCAATALWDASVLVLHYGTSHCGTYVCRDIIYEDNIPSVEMLIVKNNRVVFCPKN